MDDERELLEHVHGIFRAFLARDETALRASHADDWTGFLGPSRTLERGFEAYLAGARASLAAFRGTGYEILDSKVQVHGDLALVYYVARYDCTDRTGAALHLPLRALDVYRRDPGGWIQAGSHIGAIPAERGWGD